MDFQARLAALVAAHILAHRPLRWARLANPDVPVAVSVETGGSGDDLRIELAAMPIVFECQAKRGLSADSRLDDAIRGFAKGLPVRPEELGFLLVDPRSSRTITETLHDDLDAKREGRTIESKGALERVEQVLRDGNAEGIVERLYVRMLDVEQDTAAAANNAILILESVLNDADQAGAAWSALIAEGLRMCREGGRRDFDALVARLAHDNIYYSNNRQGSGRKLDGIQDQIRASDEQLKQNHEELKALLENIAIVTPGTTRTSDNDRVSINLDSARRLIASGRAKTALDVLQTLQREVDQAEQTTRARFHNLLGAALLHLDQIDEARNELLQVLQLIPDDLTALSNLAQAESMDGNVSDALKYADSVVEKDPFSVGAWLVIVQRRVDTTVPSEIADHPSILTAIGFRDSVAGHWESAINHLRRALDQGFDPERALFLAQALYSRAVEETQPRSAGNSLDEARKLLDDVCNALDGRTDSALFERALITRGQLEVFRGNLESAEADFGAAVARFPDSADAAYHLASSYLRNGKPDKALFVVEANASGVASAPLLMIRARAFLTTGRKDNARGALERAREVLGSEASMNVDFALTLVEIAIDGDFLDLAEPLLFHADLEPTWNVFLLRARLAIRLGDYDSAKKFYTTAVERSEGLPQREIRVEFGTMLSRNGELDAAIEQFDIAQAARGDEFMRERYARALYKKGELTRASALLETAERDGITDKWVLELGTLIARRRNDPATEEHYLERILAQEPHDVDAAIHLAETRLRLGKREQLGQLLEDLRARPDIAGWQMIQLAELHMEATKGEYAVPLAYRAVRLEPDDPQIQVAFVNVFLHREEDERGLNPDTIGPDTHVTLEGPHGEILSYLILADGPVDIRREEFLVSDARVAPLLGKRASDSVVLRSGTPTAASYRVLEIKHAVVHMFQDLMRHFNQRHPDSTALQRFHVGPNPTIENFEFLFKSLGESKERGERVLAMYREQQMPLGFIGSMLHKKIPDIYAFLAEGRGELLYVEFPDLSALYGSVHLAGSSERVILTRSALLTSRELELSDLLSHHADLIVPQSLIDELEDEVREMRRSLQHGRKAMIVVEDRFAMHEESPEETRRHHDERQNVVAWVRGNCRVLPLPFEAATDEADTWRERLGASSYDSYMLSLTEEVPLLTDDLGLRRVALGPSEQRASGFSTVAFLTALAERGDLPTQEYHRYLARLIGLNHTHAPLSAATLFTALIDTEFEIDESIIFLFDRLRAAHCEYRSAVGIVTELLQKVALSPKDATVTAVANISFECLADGHPQPDTFRLLASVVRQRLALLPHARVPVEAALSSFIESKALGG